jgi:hypothetical protein
MLPGAVNGELVGWKVDPDGGSFSFGTAGARRCGDDSSEPAVAAWSSDGSWRELPEPEPVGIRRLLSTEKGVLLLGRDGRRLQLQYLGLTDAEWTELDFPDMEVTEETEFWEATSGEVAVMGTSAPTVRCSSAPPAGSGPTPAFVAISS